MSKNTTLVKIKVCADCRSPEILVHDCICTYMNNYPTVELEFEQCNCCGRTDSYPADTEFNNQQMQNYHNGK